MSDDERKDMNTVKKKMLQIPKFVHCRRLSFVTDIDQNIYLECDCCYDKRVRTICCCKFAVFEKFLKPVGVKKWTYKEIDPMHWSAYSFYHSVNHSNLNVEEQELLQTMNKTSSDPYVGTKCSLDSMITLKMMISQINAFNDSQKISNMGDLRTIKLSPAIERLQNYDSEEAKLYLNTYSRKYHDSQRFSVSMSQPDVNNDDDNDDCPNNFADFSQFHEASMEERFQGSIETSKEHSTNEALILDTQKMFHDVLGICSKKADYLVLKEHLKNAMSDISRDKKSVTENKRSNTSQFINLLSGNKRKNSIAKADKSRKKRLG